jgi:hypothetical protein
MSDTYFTRSGSSPGNVGKGFVFSGGSPGVGLGFSFSGNSPTIPSSFPFLCVVLTRQFHPKNFSSRKTDAAHSCARREQCRPGLSARRSAKAREVRYGTQ